MSDERPNPTWSAEKMATYLQEKYGNRQVKDARTGKPIPWSELVKLFDNKRKP